MYELSGLRYREKGGGRVVRMKREVVVVRVQELPAQTKQHCARSAIARVYLVVLDPALKF